MQYTVEIEIELPRDRVIALFSDPENMKHWQEGLIGYEHLSGTPGEIGGKTQMEYQMGKRKIKMVETITKKDFPDEFAASYEASNVFNIVDNTFVTVNQERTKWVSFNEFQFKGFMKIIGFLFPGSFKKQSLKVMKDFKVFSESRNTSDQ